MPNGLLFLDYKKKQFKADTYKQKEVLQMHYININFIFVWSNNYYKDLKLKHLITSLI